MILWREYIEKMKKPTLVFIEGSCLDWVSLSAKKIKNDIRKVHFDLHAMGYYCFERCIYIFMHSLSIFTIY